MIIPVDPVAALRLAPITVTIAGQDYTVPARPAADWIEATHQYQGQMVGYLPGLLSLEDRGRFAAALINTQMPRQELTEATWDLLQVATGFEWWWVGHRLLISMVAGWGEIGGWMMATGIDPNTRPIGAVVLALLGRLQEGARLAEDKDRNRLYSSLYMPPRDHPQYRELMETVGAVVMADLAKQQ